MKKDDKVLSVYVSQSMESFMQDNFQFFQLTSNSTGNYTMRTDRKNGKTQIATINKHAGKFYIQIDKIFVY